MIVFYVTLLLFHQGYTLTPVTTVQLGDSATFTCVLPDYELNRRQLQWYKQSAGDNLKLIVTQRKNIHPAYGAGFSDSRFKVNNDKNITSLTILRTVQEDEGMYHCAVMDWSKITWMGTYLSLKEPEPHISAIVQVPPSAPVRPGDSVTLQCSVLSESKNTACPGDHSVYWFRAGSRKNHPSLIYVHGNSGGECEESSEDQTQQKCVYSFSKNINSSDAGTYYCAVATCGEILFGNRTKLDIEGTSEWLDTASAVILLLCVVLAICLIVIAAFIYTIKCDSFNVAAVAMQKHSGGRKSQTHEDMQVYSGVVFTMMKTHNGVVKDSTAAERERIYAAVKTFGLD